MGFLRWASLTLLYYNKTSVVSVEGLERARTPVWCAIEQHLLHFTYSRWKYPPYETFHFITASVFPKSEAKRITKSHALRRSTWIKLSFDWYNLPFFRKSIMKKSFPLFFVFPFRASVTRSAAISYSSSNYSVPTTCTLSDVRAWPRIHHCRELWSLNEVTPSFQWNEPRKPCLIIVFWYNRFVNSWLLNRSWLFQILRFKTSISSPSCSVSCLVKALPTTITCVARNDIYALMSSFLSQETQCSCIQWPRLNPWNCHVLKNSSSSLDLGKRRDVLLLCKASPLQS